MEAQRSKWNINPTDIRILILILSLALFSISYFILTLPVYVLVVLGAIAYKIFSWRYMNSGSNVNLNDSLEEGVSVCIVGSGFSGLCMGIKLKESGVPFRIIEKSSDVGGTWWDNRYPGCACDVWSNVYQFSFFENPNWSCFVAPANEISEYLREAAKRYSLYDHITFNTSVEKAIWNEDDKSWKVSTSNENETIVVTHLVSACGVLRKPNLPDIPGIETYEGKSFHSQQMSPDLSNIRGKRVAVIGSAASAVQICPAIVDHVKELYVFQRTPNWMIPKFNPNIPNWVKLVFTKIPRLASLVRLFLFTMFEFIGMIVLNKGFISNLYKNALMKHYQNEVQDNQELLEKVTPEFGVGCKRILLSNDFIPMFVSKANANLITEKIKSIDEKGLNTEDGKHYEVDIIVYATGFSNEESICGFEAVGRNKETTLRKYFEKHPTAYLGITVPTFPNMFLMLGPNTVLAHNSVIFMMECEADYIVDCIQNCIRYGISSIDVHKNVTDEFRNDMNRMTLNKNFSGNCRTWYKNKDGINFILWPSNLYHYWWITRKAELLRDFRITFFEKE